MTLTSLPFPSSPSLTHTPSLQTHPLALSTISCMSWYRPKCCPNKPERLDRRLWWPAIITSVYLISVFFSETPLCPSFTSLILSQDSIFDTFRKVCTSSKKTPQKQKSSQAQQHTYTHTDKQHTCAEACQSSQRIQDVLAEQTQACLCSKTVVSSFKRLFFTVKMILLEDKYKWQTQKSSNHPNHFTPFTDLYSSWF